MTTDTLKLLAQFTLLLPLGLGLLSFGLLVFSRRQERISLVMGLLTVVGAAIQLIVSVWMAFDPPLGEIPPFTLLVTLRIDALSLFFILLVNVVAFAAAWNNIAYLEKNRNPGLLQHPLTFHGLVNLFHFTMLLVPMVDNLVWLWIAIEMTTLFSAFLVAHHNNKNSWEAAWKYLIITSTGIILAMLATILLPKAVNMIALPPNVMDWSQLLGMAQNGSLSPDLMMLVFLFAFVGYGTKAGLAPMHTWLPDGHGEAPAPISALLSGVLLKSALYAILRFYTLTNAALGSSTFTSGVLLIAGLLSLIIAVPFILKRNRFKRVLAYHSLEHMGIITFGVAIGGATAMFGAVLHTLNHAITKALMFLAYGNITRQFRRLLGAENPAMQQEEISGVFSAMPVTGGILTLSGLALVGMPPFNIFMSELIILWGTVSRLFNPTEASAPKFPPWIIGGALVVFIISTTLIFYGLVNHIGRLMLGANLAGKRLPEHFWRDLFPLFFLLVFVVLLGVWVMPPLSQLVTNAVQVILGSQVGANG
jgi:hydrogenase-4 component F